MWSLFCIFPLETERFFPDKSYGNSCMRGVGCAMAHREAVRLSVLGLLCPGVASRGLRCLPELPSRQ